MYINVSDCHIYILIIGRCRSLNYLTSDVGSGLRATTHRRVKRCESRNVEREIERRFVLRLLM